MRAPFIETVKGSNWGEQNDLRGLHEGVYPVMNPGALDSLSAMRLLTKEAVRQTIGYFESHCERMRYAQFRRQELFVGSGVIEAGCKTICRSLR